MSIITRRDVQCDGDGCLQWTEGEWFCTAKQARRQAVGQGWRYVKGQDLCPKCVRAEAQR